MQITKINFYTINSLIKINSKSQLHIMLKMFFILEYYVHKFELFFIPIQLIIL